MSAQRVLKIHNACCPDTAVFEYLVHARIRTNFFTFPRASWQEKQTWLYLFFTSSTPSHSLYKTTCLLSEKSQAGVIPGVQ